MRFRRSKQSAATRPAARRRPNAPGKATKKAFSYQTAGRRQAYQVEEESGAAQRGSERMRAAEVEQAGIRAPRRLLRVALVIALSLSLLALVGYNMRLEPTAARVVVTGDEALSQFMESPDVYEQTIRAHLQDTVWQRTKPTIDTQALSEAVQAAHPEVGAVDVRLPLVGSGLTIQLVPATVVIQYIDNQGGSFLVDVRGQVIAPGDDGITGLPLVRDQSRLETTAGQQVLPAADVRFITEVDDLLDVAGLTVESVALPAAARRVEVRLAGQGYSIRMNLEEDVREQVGTYLAVKQRLEREQKMPAEYIDVRVPERAYYK